MTTSKPRLADHLASFGREPQPRETAAQPAATAAQPRPGTEVDLGQFGLGQR